jgi:alkaline phosphatase D
MRIIFLIYLAFVLTGCSTLADHNRASQNSNDKPIVILIGVDGLAWDAIDRFPAPTLNAMANTGVRAEHMTPVMPSVTFAISIQLQRACTPTEPGLRQTDRIPKN